MPKDIEELKKRTEKRHQQLRATFNRIHRRNTRRNIKPDYDDVLAQAAEECHYSFATAKKILESNN